MADDPPERSHRKPRVGRDAHAPRLTRRGGRDVPLQIEIVSSGGVRAPGLGAWLQAVAPSRARGAMTLALVPDARVRALNRQFRHENQSTDVLSFPAEEPGQLGDVVIATGVARRQAAAAGHSLQTELRVLALHGLLHLLGYDHEADNGKMGRIERRLRLKGGLREGLIERGGGA
jgi:probable rRNA maturation factor